MDFEEFTKTHFYRYSDFIPQFETRYKDFDNWFFLAKRWDEWRGANLDATSTPATQIDKSGTDKENPLNAIKNAKLVKNAIPKIVHQVWIGGDLPQKYKTWTESWKKTGYEYHLWDENALMQIFNEDEKAWFREVTNPGPRSDLARYKLLDTFGGIYCDTDFACLAPFDELLERATLFAGVTFDVKPEISGAIVASVPNHPLIKKTLKTLVQSQKTANNYNEILFKTGPAFFSRSIFENKDLLLESDVIFPSQYLYPLPNYVAVESISQKTVRKSYIKPFSLAIHYWEVSWEPEKSLLLRFIKKIVKKIIFYSAWKKS